jgi:hypothetical protein
VWFEYHMLKYRYSTAFKARYRPLCSTEMRRSCNTDGQCKSESMNSVLILLAAKHRHTRVSSSLLIFCNWKRQPFYPTRIQKTRVPHRLVLLHQRFIAVITNKVRELRKLLDVALAQYVGQYFIQSMNQFQFQMYSCCLHAAVKPWHNYSTSFF